MELREASKAVMLAFVVVLLISGVQLSSNRSQGVRNSPLAVMAHGHGMLLAFLFFVVHLDSRGQEFCAFCSKMVDVSHVLLAFGAILFFFAYHFAGLGVESFAGLGIRSFSVAAETSAVAGACAYLVVAILQALVCGVRE